MGIVGIKSEGVATPHLSLQQTKSVQLPATTIANAKGDNRSIQNYLFPNTLSGIFIMLFITMVMIIGFL